ncbi:MAG TPA: 4-aminobutyrate--2-oxoglutarate transaminase, partial [Candidatus Dormibacteraeota bacterium]|nr:4-aminobutyrate--2-oxoglutarate transaminase [Candidatus Dormibacteraeota bacterium]
AELAERFLPRAMVPAHPLVIDRAQGARMWDVNGREYIDFAGGIGVLNVGHGHPLVIAAAHRQLDRLIHTSYQVAAYEPYLRLAERLCRLAPGPSPKKAVFLNSGAEAVENAVKIARVHTGRPAVIAFTGAFHGRTLLTMAMTGKEATYKRGFGPFAPEVYRVPFPYPYRGVSGEQALAEFRRTLHDEIGAEQVAAVVMEPVQGEGGFLPAPVEFVQGVVETCRQHGILFVADEVQTGFCRTGTMFASEQYGVEPDLVCFAKSVAAGLPLAGVIGRAEVMDHPQVGGLGGTYGGNPLACAAALASLRLIREQDLLTRAAAVARTVQDRFHRWWEEFELVGEARGLGAMAAVEFVRDRTTKEPAVAEVDAIFRHSYEHGLLLLKAGTHNNVLRFLAPLVITDEQLEEGLGIMEAAIAATSRRTATGGSGEADGGHR